VAPTRERRCCCLDLGGQRLRVGIECVERGAEWKAAELLFQVLERDALQSGEALILL